MASRVFERAAERAEEDRFFLGFALAVYQAGEEIDVGELARRFTCSPSELRRISLCRRPDTTSDSFLVDVRRIANWAGVDASQLLNVIRFADAVEALRMESAGSTVGTLLAARGAADERGQDSRDSDDGADESPDA